MLTRNCRSIGAMGPLTSSTASIVDPLVESIGIPVLSLATNIMFSDKTRYPFFVRIMPPDDMQGQFLSEVVRHYNWLPTCILSDSGTYGISLAVALLNELTVANATSQEISNLTADLLQIRWRVRLVGMGPGGLFARPFRFLLFLEGP